VLLIVRYLTVFITIVSEDSNSYLFGRKNMARRYWCCDCSVLIMTLWPDHCAHTSAGADVDKELVQKPTDIVISKGSTRTRTSIWDSY